MVFSKKLKNCIKDEQQNKITNFFPSFNLQNLKKFKYAAMNIRTIVDTI